MNLQTQYNSLFNKNLATVIKMAEKYNDIVDDKDFINDVEKMQIDFENKVSEIYNKNWIVIQAYKNKNNTFVFSYHPMKNISADVGDRVKYLSNVNTVVINCSEKIINRVDMNNAKRLPNVPSRVCEKIYTPGMTLIMGVDASSINNVFDFKFKTVDFDDYYSKAEKKSTKEKHSIADAELFTNGMSYNSVKEAGNYVMFIRSNKEFYDVDGNVICNINDKNPVSCFDIVKNDLGLDCKPIEITYGQFKRLRKVWNENKLPLWKDWLAAHVTPEMLQKMYDARISKQLNGATGMFGSYVQQELTCVKILSQTRTFTKKQNEFMADLEFVNNFYESKDNNKVGPKYVKQIAKILSMNIDTSKTEIFVGPDFNKKYPFKDMVYSYNNDNINQVALYLHLVEVW